MAFRMNFSALPRCTAHAKSTGRTCRYAACKNKSVCHWHGGKSKQKHGRHTKSAKAERTAQRKLITKVRKQTNEIKKKVSVDNFKSRI